MAKKKLDQNIIDRAVNFAHDWPQHLPPDGAEKYARLQGATGEEADRDRLINYPVLRQQAAAAFAADPENTSHTEEMMEATVQIAAAFIIHERDALQVHMEKDGVTAAQLEARASGPISEWICNEANEGPQTFADLFYSEWFTDRALYLHIFLTEAVHCLSALQHGGADATLIDAVEKQVLHLIAHKWELTKAGTAIAPLPRPMHPAQKILAVDQCTRAIIDPWSEEHAKLYKHKKLVIHPAKGIDTTLTIQAAMNAVLADLSPGARSMLETCINLWDDALINGQEPVFPMDHVVRNNKCGGSAVGTKGIKVTAEEREQAWDYMRELKWTELRIDWQKEAGKRAIDDYAPIEGALATWDREPREIGGVIKDCLVINSIPLHRYASAVGRIDRRDAGLSIVDGGKRWKRTPRNVELQKYLYRQIVETDRQAGVTLKDVRIDTIWDHCQDVNGALDALIEWADLTRTTKMRFRNEVKKVLADFATNGLIERTEWLKNTRGEMNRVRVYLSKERTNQKRAAKDAKRPAKSKSVKR